MALAIALFSGNAGAASATGFWTNPRQSVAVHVEECGGSLCGRIVWLKKPRNADGELKRDTENPRPERRDALLCGLRILGGFSPSNDGRWTGGWVYNPDDGKTYRSTLEPKEDGHLDVRGYVLLPMFGRSQTWSRLEQPPGDCGRDLGIALGDDG